MKKKLFLIIIGLHPFFLSAQDTTYYSALKEGINIANQGYNKENFLELANISERISMLKTEEWLPYYYGAYAYINMSFIETVASKKTELCEKAKLLLDKAKELNPDGSEPDVLEAMHCYALMEITPMVNGPIYLPHSQDALETARLKNPANPRIYYLEGKSTMYMPSFMGGGKDKAIPLFEKAMEYYDQFVPDSEVHPSWGQADTEKLLKDCKNGLDNISD